MQKVLFIILLALSTAGCTSLLYFPTGNMYVDVKKMPTKPQEVHFHDVKGHDLAGWYFESPKHDPNKPVILFFHGNGQNISAHFFALYWILDHGMTILFLITPVTARAQASPRLATPLNRVKRR